MRLTGFTLATSRMIAAADDLGLPLVTPRAEALRGGSVMLRLADSDQAQRVLAGLRAQGIFADARGQVLRMSPGAVTTLAGTERMIAALGPLVR